MGEAPEPYEPKHSKAWTAYKFWEDAYKRTQAWRNRKNQIKEGNSHIDLGLTLSTLEAFEIILETARTELKDVGRDFGLVFEWAISIKGIADWTAIKFLAPIDDIERFDTISKLWRFCGLACMDGEAEPRDSEHYVRKLKATLLGEKGVAEQFNYHGPFPYRDIYVAYKAEKRKEYPDPVCTGCGALSPKKNGDKKSKCCNAKVDYTDGHLHNMALRKSAKEFIKHLWLVWREAEGLPITKPHPEDDVIPPPNWPLST